jgi:anti-sigma28 factor (negative regulator of flagellin synthesis)
MKIDQQNIASTGSSQSVAAANLNASNNASSGGRSSAAGNSSDEAELSGVSRAIQSFQGNRADRVNQLAALVRNGQYHANPALVSHGIVNEALSAGTQASAGAGIR